MKRITTPFSRMVFPIIYTCVLVLFLFTGNSYADMPEFQRLDPIVSNIDAPTAIATDASGIIYVVESINNRLLVYSQSGEHQQTVLGLKTPICVFVDSQGLIYVGNKGYNNVQVFDQNYTPLLKLGAGNGEFAQANDIDVDRFGNIYVADFNDNVIKVFNPVVIDEFNNVSGGDFNSVIGGYGAGNGEFNKPSSIDIVERNDGAIYEEMYVLDHQETLDDSGQTIDGARVQVLDMDGSYLRGFTKYGMQVGEMFRPQHLVVDNEDRVYVTDTFWNVVLVYDNPGTFLGAIYNETFPIRAPIGLALSSNNKLLIPSLTFKKVEVYAISPYFDMTVSPLSLTFEVQRGSAAPPVQSVEITNIGSETLNWTAETDDAWITLSDSAGVLQTMNAFSVDAGVNIDGMTAGTYYGSISIVIDTGATEVVNVTLTVQDIPLIANPGNYSGPEGQAILLDASNSSGAVVLYEWDIGNNGTYDYSSPTPTLNYAFNQDGIYVVELRVTDDIGAKDEAITYVDITDSAPVADFNVSDTNGALPLTVSFTGNATGYDQSLTYQWDFDNDGTIDSTAVNPEYTYNETGIYSVSLTVQDSDGSIDSLTKNSYITVDEACEIVKIEEVNYSLLLTAYTEAVNNATIKSQAATITESINMATDKLVILEGGYNCGYIDVTGMTVINGNLTISNGTVVIGDFIIGE